VTKAALRISPNGDVTSTVWERQREEDAGSECCSSSLVFFVGALNLLSTDGNPRMDEISQLDVLDLLSANQKLLKRLEAKNARLRDCVAELMLEIQALREALGHPQSEIRPK
jgi:hypothetical protein